MGGDFRIMARRRKPGARRPSGRLTSAAQREDVMSVALEARERHSRVHLFRAVDKLLQNSSNPEDIEREMQALAKKREAGSAIGMALLMEDISQAQFDALEAYDINQADMQRVADTRRQRSSSDFSGAGGYDSSDGTDPEYVAWCKRVKDRHNRIRNAVLTCGDPLADMALGAWVRENNRVPELLGSLRIAANAIHRVL